MMHPQYPDHPGQPYPHHGGQPGYRDPRDQMDYRGEYSPRSNYSRDPRDQVRYPPEQDGRIPYDSDPRRGDYDYQDRDPRAAPRNNNYRQDPRDFRDGTSDRRHPHPQQQQDYDRRFNNSYEQHDPSRDSSFDRDPYSRGGDRPRDNHMPQNNQHQQGMDGRTRRPPQMDERFRQVLPNGGPQGQTSPNRYGSQGPPAHQDQPPYSTNSLPRSPAAEQYHRVSTFLFFWPVSCLIILVYIFCLCLCVCDLEGVGRVQMGTGVVLGLAMVTIVLLLEHTKYYYYGTNTIHFIGTLR